MTVDGVYGGNSGRIYLPNSQIYTTTGGDAYGVYHSSGEWINVGLVEISKVNVILLICFTFIVFV